MDTKSYSVEVKIFLKPVGVPNCRIILNNQRQDLIIDKEQWITIYVQECESALLEIEHYGKDELDPITELIIDHLQFIGMNVPNFVYHGIYVQQDPVLRLKLLFCFQAKHGCHKCSFRTHWA